MCEYNTLDTTSTPQTLPLLVTRGCQVRWGHPSAGNISPVPVLTSDILPGVGHGIQHFRHTCFA